MDLTVQAIQTIQADPLGQMSQKNQAVRMHHMRPGRMGQQLRLVAPLGWLRACSAKNPAVLEGQAYWESPACFELLA